MKQKKGKKIKPCPFCGEQGYTWHNDRILNTMLWGVECHNCGAMVWVFPEQSEDDAIELWNGRVKVEGKEDE